MKTPMQELIDEIKSARRMCDDPTMEMDIFHTLDVLTSKAKSLLEKEKEVIMNAYDIGWSDGNKDQDLNDLYYNETFNTKEK